MDYKALGLKVGLEIHQQLATHKLFCNCESELNEDEAREFTRNLKPAQSEMGEVDSAAMSEAKKHLSFRYQAPASVCLVEADEEPPHEVNAEALDIALEFASLVDSDIVDEIHFMRKIVIDGSNTAGFQRTAMIALGGNMTMGDLAVDGLLGIGISTISLEEDAARKVRETASEVVYRLDRLGIPLIEIATEPEISTPDQAKNVALRIGALLRATKKVKRGIGTIREDLNISISEGARVEIKGVQDPKLISFYVEEEVKRQLLLVVAKKELEKRNVDWESFYKTKDLSSVFRNTRSKILSEWLKEGGIVYGIKLAGFAHLLGGHLANRMEISAKDDPITKERRVLGPEFADYIKPLGIKGLFHSDELPGYGISEEEVEAVKSSLEIGDLDAFVLIAEMEYKAKEAGDIIMKRALSAFSGVLEETRDPQPDGTTTYSRPLPGKARMYPETDVPPIRITKEKMDGIRTNLPEFPEEKQKRLADTYNINLEWAGQLIGQDLDEQFEGLVSRHPNIQKVIGRVLLSTMAELESDGLDINKIDNTLLEELFTSLEQGGFAKEGISELLRHMIENDTSLESACSDLNLKSLEDDKMTQIIEAVVNERLEFVKEKGMEAVGPLMGNVMKELRGKVDGKKVNIALKKKVQDIIGN